MLMSFIVQSSSAVVTELQHYSKSSFLHVLQMWIDGCVSRLLYLMAVVLLLHANLTGFPHSH